MTGITFFIIFVPILSIILLAVNLLFATHNPYDEKRSTFECGFHSFLGQNRTQFNISFFIFALLFLLFDLEILLIYPYSVSHYTNELYGLIIMLIFFIILTIGFTFEFGKKALKIDSKQLFKVNSISKHNVLLRSSSSWIMLLGGLSFGVDSIDFNSISDWVNTPNLPSDSFITDSCTEFFTAIVPSITDLFIGMVNTVVPPLYMCINLGLSNTIVSSCVDWSLSGCTDITTNIVNTANTYGNLYLNNILPDVAHIQKYISYNLTVSMKQELLTSFHLSPTLLGVYKFCAHNNLFTSFCNYWIQYWANYGKIQGFSPLVKSNCTSATDKGNKSDINDSSSNNKGSSNTAVSGDENTKSGEGSNGSDEDDNDKNKDNNYGDNKSSWYSVYSDLSNSELLTRILSTQESWENSFDIANGILSTFNIGPERIFPDQETLDLFRTQVIEMDRLNQDIHSLTRTLWIRGINDPMVQGIFDSNTSNWLQLYEVSRNGTTDIFNQIAPAVLSRDKN